MRDLNLEELTHVYGAGGRGRSRCYNPCKGSRSKHKKSKSKNKKRKSSKRYC